MLASVEEQARGSTAVADPPRSARHVARGALRVERVAGRSVVTRARAGDPLKLLTPRRAGDAAWVYTSTYGGGLLAGDRVELEVGVADGATLVLATQASTKVYRSGDGGEAAQALTATVGERGLLAVLPDPVSPFAGSRYTQRQRCDLHPDASLVLLDWFTCGRLAMGERWALSRLQTRNEVRVGGRCALLDATHLDAAAADLHDGVRLGRFHCFATVLFVGPRVEGGAAAACAAVEGEPLRRNALLIAAASACRGGRVIRIAGERTEAVGRCLRDLLAFLADELGDDPWSRKW